MAPESDEATRRQAGARVAKRRLELGLSVRGAAQQTAGPKKVTATTWGAIEKGARTPHEHTLAKMDRVLQWPVGTLARIFEDPRHAPSTVEGAEEDAHELVADLAMDEYEKRVSKIRERYPDVYDLVIRAAEGLDSDELGRIVTDK